MVQEQASSGQSSSPDLLKDLGAYLSLEKAQRAFGFDTAKLGLTEVQAASIAGVFARYDKSAWRWGG
jgi:hypothetical protein